MGKTRRYNSGQRGTGASGVGYCGKEQKHETREEANAHRVHLYSDRRKRAWSRRRNGNKKPMPLTVYRCDICDYWHVGSDIMR